MTGHKHRIAIVDDSVLLREGLARLIEDAGLSLAAAFGSGAELMAAMPGLDVDLIIMDVRMPPTFTDEGLRLAIELRSARPRLPVLILSQFVESLYAQELFSNGQGYVGYLLKDRLVSIDVLYDAIERIIAGGTVLDPEVVSTLINARQDPLVSLTPRERDVLGAMAEGLTNQGIAQRLNIGLGTVEKHATEIFSKLELNGDTLDHRRVLAVLTWLRKSPAVGR